jgi:hypothetical protein
MTIHPALRRAIAALAALCLLWLGWEGIHGGFRQWSGSLTAWQRVQTLSQLLYGAFALLSLATAFTWRQFRRFAELGFILGASAAAGVASVVWGGKSILVGVVSALGAVLIAALIMWMLRVGLPADAISRGEA